MKKLILFLIVFVISCSNTTEPTEVIVDKKGVELNWIRFRDDNAWYLAEYKELFTDIVYDKFECSEIVLFETDLLFIFEIDEKKSVNSISPSRDTSWVWCEKK